MLNIIGDIAGQYKTLLALIAKMPRCKVLAVGDLIDRGPRSREVIEYFQSNPQHSALLGNHEHMMLCECRDNGIYQSGIWFVNGGRTTLKSYGSMVPQFGPNGIITTIPESVLKWVERLPLYLDLDNVFVSHSFVCPDLTIKQVLDINNLQLQDYNILWNREYPKRMPGKFQIAGHNSHWGLRRFGDEQGEFAIGIDTSRQNVLTGIHYPSMTIYQQPYID